MVFGEDWFRPIREQNNPLGILRRVWIVQQLNEDRRQEFEDLGSLAEAIGSWSNPEYYDAYQKAQKGQTGGGSFRIVHDDREFQRRIGMAVRGEVEIHDQRTDIQDKIKAKRTEKVRAEVQDALRDPRIVDPYMGMQDFPDDGDALDIVIRKGVDD